MIRDPGPAPRPQSQQSQQLQGSVQQSSQPPVHMLQPAATSIPSMTGNSNLRIANLLSEPRATSRKKRARFVRSGASAAGGHSRETRRRLAHTGAPVRAAPRSCSLSIQHGVSVVDKHAAGRLESCRVGGAAPRPGGGSALDQDAVFHLSQVSMARNGKEILKNIDWTVPAGRVSIVLGPTGSGKTSLLRLLNRLDDPSSGEIRYMGAPLSSIDVRDLRVEVGMVLQQPFLFEGTVLDNILYGCRLHGMDVDPAEITALVGIDEAMLRQDVSTLSVGQSQKVSIARAVALRPRVLLLDEPTSGLDPTSTVQVEELVSGLVRALGLTCVFVTHRIEQARRLGHRGILIIDGSRVEEREIEDMLSSPADERTRRFLNGELR